MNKSLQVAAADVEQAGTAGYSNGTSSEEESSLITVLEDPLDKAQYPGETLEEQIDSLIQAHGVVVFSKTFCPFCLDVKDFLANRWSVPVMVLEVNSHPDGAAIHKIVKAKTNQTTVPVVYIKGSFVGGCNDVKALAAQDLLEERIADLIARPRVHEGHTLETAKMIRPNRDYRTVEAVQPPFWFPNTVNNKVVRGTGIIITIMSIVVIVCRNEEWAKWVVASMLIDFTLRMLVGSSLSPIGMLAMVATAPWKPQFRPGPPKQFAAFFGVLFTTAATILYFLDQEIAGAVVMGLLACAAGLEGFLGFCFGCEAFQLGIQYGLINKAVYRIHTSTLQETKDSWKYKYLNSGAPKPPVVDTDPSNPIALKYKKKTDEWTKDDFDLIRNMKPCYFAIPLAISGCAVAFKMASDWGDPFRLRETDSTIVVPRAWYQTMSVIAAVIYSMLLPLYFARLILYPKKCRVEWQCPQRSVSFGAMTITLMLFAFLLYDEIDGDGVEGRPQKTARAILWVGGIVHTILTIAKFSEWVGIRLEMEHLHPQWIIMPVGLSVASLVGSVVPFFEIEGNPKDPGYDGAQNWEANILLARFFLSFAFIMWIVLFSVSFLKVVTGHNSDNRFRHGVWTWLAAPCVIGLADFGICMNEAQMGIRLPAQCDASFDMYFFIGIFLFLSFGWMTLPYIGFFGRDPFNKGYWMDCFCIDTLAACAAMFYTRNNFLISRTLMILGLTIAGSANLIAFFHTVVALIRRRDFFTPMVKWGPLSWFKLTHESFRGAIPRLEKTLAAIDLESANGIGQEQLEVFAARYSTFVSLHIEHAKHEDQVIFKTFNDFFPEHAKEYMDDHEEDRIQMESLRVRINQALDISLDMTTRKSLLLQLQKEMPEFFAHFLEHIRGEEDNLQPIGRKYMSLELQKQMARQCFVLTDARQWEVLLPYILEHLPRHMQRVRYLKSLCWSMPERAQQLGAIVYRNVDAVLWERLRIEIPEITPRGERNYRKYM